MLFLNESTEVNGEEHVDIENDFVVQDTYTGDDTELLDIMVTHEQDMHNLTIAMMRAEHRSIVSEDKSISEAAEASFFQRVWTKIKEFWAKVVSFFNALWTKITTLFVDREKWVGKNKDAINKGASKAKMSLPGKFKDWNSQVRINDAEKKAGRVFSEAQNAADKAAGRMGFLRSLVNKIFSGKEEANVNYTKMFADEIGEMVETPLHNVINSAMREAMASKIANAAMKQVRATEKAALANAKKAEKGGEKSKAALTAINTVSTATAAYSKALHNTVVKMCNYGWAACRKAAASAGKKEDVKKEGLDLDGITDVNHDEENDALSQYMPA